MPFFRSPFSGAMPDRRPHRRRRAAVGLGAWILALLAGAGTAGGQPGDTPGLEGAQAIEWVAPAWLLPAGIAICAALVLSGGFIAWLRVRMRKATRELRENEAKYRLLVESQTELIVKVDAGGRFLFVSPSYCELFGKTEAELLGSTFLPLVHEQDQASTREAMRALHRPPHTCYVEQRAMTRHGWRWLAWADKAILGPDGAVEAVVGVGRDVTNRKRTEQALRESEARYRLVIDQSSDVLQLVNADGSKRFVSPAAERMFGFSADEMVRRSYDLIHPDDVPVIRRGLTELLAHPQTIIHDQFRHLCKDGRYLWVESVAQNRLDQPGLEAIVLTLRDVSSRKRAEEERLELERRLLEAQKLESLGVLAGGVAHDFNNLLAAILGNIDLARQDQPRGSATREYLDQAVQSARRAADLVRQILAYSGRGRMVTREVDLNALVRESAAVLRATLPHGIVLEVGLAPDLPPFEADPAQLQQVVLHLLTNAAEASGAPPTVVRVRTGAGDFDAETLKRSRVEHAAPAGRYAWLEVSDAGAGMDEATQRRIFEPFFSTRFAGRGLGLPVVMGIVRRHRGAILLVSRPGAGTTVRALFPIAAPATPEAADGGGLPAAQPLAARAATPRSGPATILVVDDEPMVRRLCSRMIERMGHRVVLAASGEEALEQAGAREVAIDLVLLDLSMPGLDGVETLGALRKVRRDLAVIVTSGSSEDDARSRLGPVEVAGFLQKPFAYDSLEQVLRTVLQPR